MPRNPVQALGYGCLVLGALMVVCSALSEAALAAARMLGGDAAFPQLEVAGFVAFEMEHHVAFAVGQAILGLLTVLVGVGVLRRRRWALFSLEGLAWLGILLNLVTAPFFISSYRDWPAEIGLAILAGTALLTVALTVASLLLIRFLRSARVRDAFTPGQGT